MSHRKYEKPRSGNLGFLPKRRTRHHRGRIRSFPKDDSKVAPHLTAFTGFKAGMTHVVREVERTGSDLHKKEVIEAATIIETPPMIAVGIVGYSETVRGLRALSTVWAQNLSEAFKRRFSKNWYRSKKKVFSKATEKFAANSKAFEIRLNRIKKYCSVVRLICHTQPKLLNNSQSKANILEIQINGGDIAAKVDFGKALFEKEIKIDQVFNEGDITDVIGVTKGLGTEGVIRRFGVKKLPRKTHRGLRRVGCIGAWHPERVRFTIARAGQCGYHHRTEVNKRIYRIGKSENLSSGATENDPTVKGINPLGGFPHYGIVKNDFILIKGCCVGTKKRPLVLRKPLHKRVRPIYLEKIHLKFIDTSSKLGHGRFQTSEEKDKYFISSRRVAEKKEAQQA